MQIQTLDTNWTSCVSLGTESSFLFQGPLTRYVKLRVVHAPGMPGTISLPLRVSNPDMHHDTCVTHVPWCMPESLTSDFFWSRWRGKRSPNSRRMRNRQFCVSSNRPIAGFLFSQRFITWSETYCMSNSVKVALNFNVSPIAAAPSTPNPFHDILSFSSVMFCWNYMRPMV